MGATGPVDEGCAAGVRRPTSGVRPRAPRRRAPLRGIRHPGRSRDTSVVQTYWQGPLNRSQGS